MARSGRSSCLGRSGGMLAGVKLVISGAHLGLEKSRRRGAERSRVAATVAATPRAPIRAVAALSAPCSSSRTLRRRRRSSAKVARRLPEPLPPRGRLDGRGRGSRAGLPRLPARALATGEEHERAGAHRPRNQAPHRRGRYFPTDQSGIRLVGAILAKQHDDRHVARHYLSAESLAKLSAPNGCGRTFSLGSRIQQTATTGNGNHLVLQTSGNTTLGEGFWAASPGWVGELDTDRRHSIAATRSRLPRRNSPSRNPIAGKSAGTVQMRSTAAFSRHRRIAERGGDPC